MKTLIIHARAKKLGDCVVISSVINDFLKFSVAHEDLKVTVILPRTFDLVPMFYNFAPTYYSNEITLFFAACRIKIRALVEGQRILFSNISGESTVSKWLRWILSPMSYTSRERNRTFGKVDGKNVFKDFQHSSQFEYSELPLQLLCPGFQASRNVMTPRRIRAGRRGEIVVIAPFSAENRRSLTDRALDFLISETSKLGQVRLIFNPTDAHQQSAAQSCSIRHRETPNFALLPCANVLSLWKAIRRSSQVFAVDSGVYVVTAVAGVKATVFYGPSQPSKTVYNPLKTLKVVRAPELGERHCHNRDCVASKCIDVALGLPTQVEKLPPACLLKS